MHSSAGIKTKTTLKTTGICPQNISLRGKTWWVELHCSFRTCNIFPMMDFWGMPWWIFQHTCKIYVHIENTIRFHQQKNYCAPWYKLIPAFVFNLSWWSVMDRLEGFITPTKTVQKYLHQLKCSLGKLHQQNVREHDRNIWLESYRFIHHTYKHLSWLAASMTALFMPSTNFKEVRGSCAWKESSICGFIRLLSGSRVSQCCVGFRRFHQT